jgi:cytochrome c nitrite reductase small subunit
MNLIRKLTPPPSWKLPVVIVLGIFTGLGMLTIHISRAPSYLSNKPETCINCHVMYPQYATWKHSSHRDVAVCSDCHVPHDNFFRTYYFKASDGARHATIFTARAEPHVIQIKNAGKNVVQENCIRCHQDLVEMTTIIEVTGKNYHEGAGNRCWDCHRDVPHGTVRSLSSAPFSLVPKLPSVTPSWLQNYLNREKN